MVDNDDEEFELQVVCTSACFIQYYYTTYVAKTLCMNSSRTGYI